MANIELDLAEMGAVGTGIVTDVADCPEVKPGEGQVITATFRHPPSTDVLDVWFEDSVHGTTERVGSLFPDSQTTDADSETVAPPTNRTSLVDPEKDSRPSTNAPANSETLTAASATDKWGESIGVTDNHLFWSVDRQQFVPIGEMEIGERVQTYHGETKRIASKLPRPGPPKEVYNLEVYGEHVYFVGEQWLLAHNNCAGLSRREYLNRKFGRSGNLDADINTRGGLSVASRRDAAFASVKSVRRQVERVMRQDPNMRQLLSDGDTMTYGFVFDARMKARLGVIGGRTPRVPGVEGTHAVIRPGGRYGVRGDYRMPDLRYRDEFGSITEFWDIKPKSFEWNQQFADIERWSGITPIPIGYNR